MQANEINLETRDSLGVDNQGNSQKITISETTTIEKKSGNDYSIRPEFFVDDERAPDDGIPYQFTWRGTLIGSILGCVVTASSMYIGLKTGWSVGGTIFIAILAWVMIKCMEKLPEHLGGGAFGIKENCTVQTAASAASGVGAGFTGAIPAMFQLGLMPPLNQAMAQLAMWTLAGAFYGLFFAIPLRKHFIINQKLVFPSALAAAKTIQSLHVHSDGGENLAVQQSKWILFSLLAATLFKLISFFVPFIFDMHILWWIGSLFNYHPFQTASLKFKWRFQWSPAFIGIGLLIGTNAVLSFMLGDVLAWGLISPSLIYFTSDIVQQASPWGTTVKDGLVTAQFWNLWPGVVMIIVSTFTDVAFHYKTMYTGFKSGIFELYNLIASKLGRDTISMDENANCDPVPQHEQILTWQWVLGLSVSTIFTILVLCFYFNVKWYFGVLAIILGFLLSIVGVQTSGQAGINPTGTIGKVSQFVFAPIPHPNPQLALQVNLFAGNVAATCASQTSDMINDLKTGHLLRASPKSQFYAQIFGSFFGVASTVLVFWVYGTAYPCILSQNDDPNCPFETPAALAWRGVALALTSNISDSIPTSSQIACLVLGLLSLVITILRRTWLKKYAHLTPNMNLVGLAFVSPLPYLPLAAFIGMSIGLIWKRYNPKHYEKFHIALASGFKSGEGIGGICHAILTIIGLNQGTIATGFACPNNLPLEC